MSDTATPDHDPRPQVLTEGSQQHLTGVRCAGCGWSSVIAAIDCGRCGRVTDDATFVGVGTLWSWTVVRIPVADLTPPYTLAFIDLDGGPRVLVHLADDRARVTPIEIGARVTITGRNARGDLAAELDDASSTGGTP